MTVLAGMVLGNTMAIAGDRQATEGSTGSLLATPKIASKGKYLVGYYGSMEGDRLLKMFSFPEPPREQEATDEFMFTDVLKELHRFYENNHFNIDAPDETSLGLLILVNGQIYSHDIGDGSMNRFSENFQAVGTGGPYALGALSVFGWKSAETATRTAVEIACRWNIYCSEPVDVLTKTWRKRSA